MKSEHEMLDFFAHMAMEDAQYAIAYSQMIAAQKLDRIGGALHALGNADAATPMGAIEGLGAVFTEMNSTLMTIAGEMNSSLMAIAGALEADDAMLK